VDSHKYIHQPAKRGIRHEFFADGNSSPTLHTLKTKESHPRPGPKPQSCEKRGPTELWTLTFPHTSSPLPVAKI
jgi:hypothetical protein